ncbi:hypothetical protein ACFOE0_22410, partial [Shewanella submarina]
MPKRWKSSVENDLWSQINRLKIFFKKALDERGLKRRIRSLFRTKQVLNRSLTIRQTSKSVWTFTVVDEVDKDLF